MTRSWKRAILTPVRRIARIFGAEILSLLEYERLQGYKKTIKEKRGFSSDIFGHKMYVAVNDMGYNPISLSGVPIDRYSKFGEIGFLLNELRPGQTALDIGANIGFFTLLFARQVGDSGRVIAFEPGPLSFALLKANIIINGYDNVTLVNKAVASTTGTQKLFICPTGESDNQLAIAGQDFGAEVRSSVDVEVVSLDDYFSKVDYNIDFIKMDIQGSEYMALQGMKSLLERNKDIRVLVEYSPRMLSQAGVEPKRFLDFVRSFGFNTYDLYRDKRMAKVDDQYLLTTYGTGETSMMTNLVLQRF